MVIAIDGPAGAGKSSVARAVAQRLGFRHLDTGAMYRAVALAALRRGVEAGEIVDQLAIEVGERVVLDGEDVSEAIRAPEVSQAASRAAADPRVRAALVARQQRLLARGDWVAEGRDVGTVVAPDARVKVFLTASATERARRRAAQLGADAARVAAEQSARDRRDSERPHAPLRPAEDAVVIDTTAIAPADVVARIVALARRDGSPAAA
jgi:cytidylate kinase